jgi:hypothetical protein
MSRRPRPTEALLSVLAGVVLVTVVAIGLTRPAATDSRAGEAGVAPARPASVDTDAPAEEARGGPDAADANPEAEELAEIAHERNEAFERAKQAGKTGQSRPAAAVAAPGWTGEIPFDTQWDDWEPAIATDPHAPYVYAVVTRYGAPKPCPGNCPTPFMALEISADDGGTWSAGKPLCACKGSGQFDPIIEVVPSTGQVYAVYMNGYNVVFVKSANHGTTWSAPVATYGNVSWNDKPVLAVSDNGQDVYVSFNGPTGGDPWVAQSHDFGATWTQRKLVNGPRYFFDFDADVASDTAGTVYFAETSILYGGGGNKGTTPTGDIEEHVFISRDHGANWEDHLVASVKPGVACDAAGCTPDFYLGHAALSADAAGNLVLLYDGATTAGGRQTISARRSTDRGVTWLGPVQLSATGEESTAPAIESTGTNDVRAWYYQTSGGGNDDAWNVWYRRSTDGGATWAAPVKLSDATSGAAYKTAAGFLEVYGDYGELAITNTGKSIAIWGEGSSYTGPGGVWLNREP